MPGAVPTACTRRLRIEPLTPAHAAAMHEMLSDARLYRYMPDLRLPSAAALAQRYERLAAGSGDPDERWLNCILFLRDDAPASGRPIGFVQATVAVRLRLAELAYVLAPAQWGQGLAREAVDWLIGQLKDGGTVETLQVRIDTRNLSSLALARRLGFVAVKTVEEDGSIDTILRRPLLQPSS